MSSTNTLSVCSADNLQPISLTYRRLEFAAGNRLLPVIEYMLADHTSVHAQRTALFLAGGGSSGVVFARAAQLCAARDVRVVMFDMPGHTHGKLLGAATPTEDLMYFASPAVRSNIVDLMVKRWVTQAEDRCIDIVSHSAGFLDASLIDPSFAPSIGRFVVLGAGMPGFDAMRSAYRAASMVKSTQAFSLLQILRKRTMPTGGFEVHFGPLGQRLLDDAALQTYQGDEHFGVGIKLMFASSLGSRLWPTATIELICSAGDKIAPQTLMRTAASKLSNAGALVNFHLIEAPLPHMFMMFEAGAHAISEIICSTVQYGRQGLNGPRNVLMDCGSITGPRRAISAITFDLCRKPEDIDDPQGEARG